ncbi:MAG: MFS transporter [Mitsuaria chitosanitabida]|uniref:MFS transporter n=1 Tax=Roseateles chitosanitabidus TaxID=65048 RepID=UPI001B1E177C|nr:MFS transporter [Roseateles chitosanitabidus]MBO9685843.1 MFS transporter [Roseateles chitosanitabidus]
MSAVLSPKDGAGDARVPSSSGFPLPILALALAAFAIGTTEFVIMGLLPAMARDLAVSLPGAGLLVTGYALGVALGAPPLAALSAGWPRKRALLVLIGLFIAGNALSAIGTGYGLVMAGRIVAALAHGSFFGIGAVLASELVAPDRKAGAIALMFTGLTLANVLGVPLGNLIGQAWGWRASFAGVALLGVIAAVALVALLPKPAASHEEAATGNDWSVLKRPQVLIALALTAVGFGGVFTAFTFIAPMLEDVTGLSAGAVTGVLFLFGLGLTLGNTLGGKLADWKLMPSLMGVLVVLALIQLVLAAVLSSPWAAIAAVFVWGVAAFATVPGLQMRMMQQAPDAPALVSTLNIAAFNLGNAGGAWLGGWMLDHGASLRALPVAGAALAVVGLGLAAVSVVLERRAR